MIASLAAAAVERGLPAPSTGSLLTQVHLTPLGPVLVVLAGGWYISALRRGSGIWPARRTVTYFLGLVLVLALTCGGLSAYSESLFWAWTLQVLLLFLVAPVLLVAGQPIELTRRAGSPRLPALARSAPARTAGNPFIGPLLVPVISVGLFFGPVPGWTVQFPVFAALVQLVVLVVGVLIVAPLLAVHDEQPSLYIGLAMVIGVLELLIDAVPGIVLRLQTHLSSSFGAHRHLHAWTGSAFHDQQAAGGVLWAVAELIDLPFLVLVFFRWIRADTREANAVDSILDAEHIVRTSTAGGGDPSVPGADQPWWLSDPQLGDRVRRDRDR